MQAELSSPSRRQVILFGRCHHVDCCEQLECHQSAQLIELLERCPELSIGMHLPETLNKLRVVRLLAALRERKSEVARLLRAQTAIPAGSSSIDVPAKLTPALLVVRIVDWDLKQPPVAIDYHSVVTDTARFVSATLGELQYRLANPKRKYGWAVPQLVDRLAQVGVTVALEFPHKFSEVQQ